MNLVYVLLAVVFGLMLLVNPAIGSTPSVGQVLLNFSVVTRFRRSWWSGRIWGDDSDQSDSDSDSGNHPPSFNNCPSETIEITAPENMMTAIVTWAELTVSNFKVDSDSNMLEIQQRRGPVKNTNKPEGSYLVEYEAMIGGDLVDSCSFLVVVKVIRCDCPPIQFGGVQCSSTDIIHGTTCNFTCGDRYIMQGSQNVSCLSTGEFDTLPTCERYRCDSPIIKYGEFQCSSSEIIFGSICNFTCGDRYMIQGSPTATCLSTEQFDTLPTCALYRCDSPIIEYGAFQCSSSEIIFGSICNFTCGDRYRIQGSQTATCLDTGEFDTIPTCARYRCDSPIIEYGAFQCSSEIIFGSICNFTCSDGYMINGSQSATCLSTGKFDSLPTCERYRCDSPIIEYGAFQCSSEIIFGSICNFTCGDGYMINGSQSATCLSTGKFDSLPTCERYRCDSPIIEYGAFQCSSEIIFGSICNFTCGDRYMINGSQSATCLSTGKFDSLPTCERYRCDSPIIEYGAFQCSSSEIIFGSICNFTCGDRYMIHGSQSATCLPTGEFDSLPTCAPFRCDDPCIENGEFKCIPSDVRFGSTCTFTCNIGYMLVGEGNSICLSTGGFTTLPYCENINDCESEPCQNDGTCTDAINAYSCTCVPGVSGDHCEIDILNECESNPCQNSANCTDLPGGFSCNCTSLGYIGANCQIVCNTTGPLDLVFILDKSGSVGAANFNKMLQFIASVVDELVIGPSATQVALIAFGITATNEFNLNTHGTKQAIKNDVLDTFYPSRHYTSTHAGLAMARLESFTSANGDRATAINVAVVITDGLSTFVAATATQAQLLRQSGVKVIAVGVGNANLIELNTIATDPDDQNVVVTSFNALGNIKEAIIRLANCEG